MINYYKVLGLKDFADIKAIKAAHRKRSKVYHPDLNNGSKYHEEKFKEVQHAYEQLRDPETKARHDAALNEHYRKIQEASTAQTYNTTDAEYVERPFVYEPRVHKSPRIRKRWYVLIAIGTTAVVSLLLRAIEKRTPQLELPPVKQVDIKLPPMDTSKHYVHPAYKAMPHYMRPPEKPDPPYFNIGATMDEVSKRQGAPTSIMAYKEEEIWSYGNSLVTFKAGVVISYNNIDGNLKVRGQEK